MTLSEHLDKFELICRLIRELYDTENYTEFSQAQDRLNEAVKTGPETTGPGS